MSDEHAIPEPDSEERISHLPRVDEPVEAVPTRRPGRPRTRRGEVTREQKIIDAAVTVFAREGFHEARVSDIAREADVAYGLVYHYFKTKEAVLERIFEQTWTQLSEGLRAVSEREAPVTERLESVVKLMLKSYRLAPDLIRVLVVEVTRSGHLRGRVDAIAAAFSVIEDLIREGQESGELRTGLDAKLASYALWGTIDEVLTGWVFDALVYEDDAIDTVCKQVADLIIGGLAVR
jgi:AcrR family transcriptional regulator